MVYKSKDLPLRVPPCTYNQQDFMQCLIFNFFIMELLTDTLRKRFQEIGRQDETTNPIIVTKFFNPTGAGTWYITEFYPEDQCVYGYVTGLGYDEWGYISLLEIKAYKSPLGIGIERDISFEEQRFLEVKEIHGE